jgi:putative tricarboxylic transport membrane protein
VLTFIAAWPATEFKFIEVLILATVLAVFSYCAFVLGLKLQFQVWPSSSPNKNAMDLINNLSLGFGVAFTLQNLLYAFLGCLLGTLIGVLPGIGPVATIAMLLPATYALPPRGGADHAGRHLLRRAVRRLDHRHPGQPAGRIVLGGDRDRRLPDGAQGRAGPALAAAGIGSFFAGCVGTLILAGFARR